MGRATDRIGKDERGRRRIGLGLTLMTVSAFAGCAELRGSWPNGMAKPFRADAQAPAYDPYLAPHRPPTAPSGPAVADVGAPDLSTKPLPQSTKPAEGSLADPTAPNSLVKLEPPVSLPVAARERPASAPTPDVFEAATAIVAKARTRVDGMANYQVQVNRQERVNGSLLPVEDVVLSIRREPRAVRLEWPSGPHKGREVIYSTSDPSGLMHVKMADSIIPVPNMALTPDSPLVMRSSRHPITEAGFETIIAALETSIAAGRSDPSKVGYPGIETPPAVGRPCHTLTRTVGDEQWRVSIDVATSLPAMVEATSTSGELLERYIFRSVTSNVPELLTANAFDAGSRWGNSPGLLGRIARSGGGDAKATATPTVR